MKKITIILVFAMMLISLNFITAQKGSICCEKTLSGAWCQNVDSESLCNSDYKIAPTHCSSTAYCRLGCCYDTKEGICMENTPESNCQEGKWFSSSKCDIEPCKAGCCLMGDQAAFVTQQRCKTLSGLYGLETNFRSDISNELQCIATATSDREGACVYEDEYQVTCKRGTRSECDKIGQDAKFYEGLLCTAPQLNTNCEPTTKTTCVDGKDGVYYLDNCGNIANIYDYNKKDDIAYWTYIAEQKDDLDVCKLDSNLGNANTCGNCDYYEGSLCKKYERFEDPIAPSAGDYICQDLSCEYKGEKFKHGESWCGFTNPNGKDYKLNEVSNLDLIGGRYYRLICYNGEVTLEPCADYRQEICIESEIGNSGFKNSLCIANKWQDCYSQDNKKDCENTDKRNCKWINKNTDDVGTTDGIPNEISCVPKNTPGLDFWGNSNAKENTGSSQSEGICSIASKQITVTCSDSLKGGKECDHDDVVNDDGIILQSWKEKMNSICSSLGDCGIKQNYALFKGNKNNFDDFIESTEQDI